MCVSEERGDKVSPPTSKLISNSYLINENLQEVIQLTDEAIRKDVSAKRNFILSVLALSALILVLILGIVSVAHATNKPIAKRVWISQENKFSNK